jgi:hypothetical protein
VKFAVLFRVLVMFATLAAVLLMFGPGSMRALRGWWADRVQVWRARREWKRRKLARASAQAALDPDDIFGRRERAQARSIDIGIAVGLALAVVAAMLLHGCGGRYPIDGADDAASHAPADSGAADTGAPEVHEPQCADLTPGEEFFAADTGAELATLILNDQGCTKFCRNTAGGATCVSAQNTLVRCAACQAVSP